MDEQTLSLIPATEEDLQYLNPEPQSPGLVPATEEDLQYITPEIREPTMQEMTSDFETFKMFRKAGAFDSGKTATEMVTEGVSGMASDLGHWAKTLPIRLAQNFADDKYSFNRKAKAQAKATTLQTLGNLELDYKSIGAGITRGIDKVFGDAETEEDLLSSYEFFKTQADLEKQRQGKAAEMVTEGFLGMSPEFLTLGMPEEQRELIRSQQVMPDMKAARGGSFPSDPTNFIPMGAAFKLATGTGRATLKGAEKVLINETLQLAKLQDDMTKALSRVGDNTIKSRRLAIKQAPAKARLEKGLAEVTEKIAENQAKLKPLAAKRDIALTKLASDLPVGNPLKEFLNDALKEVPIKQPLNLTNKVGGAGLIAVGKPIEYLGNALQFIKTLPQETAINMLMKAGDKVGMEVTEQNAKLLIKSGVIGGVGYGGYSFAGEFTDSELGKLGGAVGALLGPQFLARFGRNTAILGRETMKPASDLPFFTRLASKDAEKMTTQLIDRTALVPIESVARQVTGAAEGKILSRMGGPEAFGRMSPSGQATVNFLDRTGLGRYVESTGRMAKGVGAGGAVGGAFGLAASGGMDMPEAFYGGIGAGMLFGSAGAVGGEVARFTNPINHMEARYGDLYHYAENYLPAGQKESFNKLNRDVQMAVANKIVANPSLAIEYVSKGKDGEGGYFDRLTGDIVINVDSPRAIEPLLAHEFTHYLEQTGGKRKFIDLLIGNPVIGKPGIFVQRVTQQNKSRYPDLKVGDPIMVGEGANRKFLLSDEFETARSDYGKKLQDTLLDSDGNKMSDSDLAKIMTDEQTVSEIVAEHGTDFLLNDKRKYRDRNRGTIGKIMGGMLDTELVQNIPLLRKTLAMMGGTFRPDGKLITDNKLFSNIKRYPQITELVRKYNNQLEGMSPQKRQALEASGEIQGGNIKSGERSTKEVVVDIKSAELAKSPQLAELLRSGTLLQIDKDGNVIPNLAMTSREQGKYNRSFAEKMKEAIEEKEANEGLPEGHVRPEVNTKTGKIRFVGRYLDDSVIDKLEQSGNWNKEQIQTLRDVNFNIRNKGGNEYLISYFKAAGQGGGKYVNAKVENHIEVPYGFEITQKNNIILRTVSVNQLVKNVDQLARQQQAELTRLYGADVAQAKVKLLQDLDRYHRNHADGQPGRTGLDADQNIAKAKADFINSAFGSGTKAEAGSNPWRQSLGKKNPRDVYRSRRIERIGKMDQLSGTRFIDYDKINKAFIPKPEADVAITEKLFMPRESKGLKKKVLLRTTDEVVESIKAEAKSRGISANDVYNERLANQLPPQQENPQPVKPKKENDITLNPEELRLLEKKNIGPEDAKAYRKAIEKRRKLAEASILGKKLFMPQLELNLQEKGSAIKQPPATKDRAPTFWKLFKINPKDPKVYDKVADVLIDTGTPSNDPANALDHSQQLGLDPRKLRQAMARAQRRYFMGPGKYFMPFAWHGTPNTIAPEPGAPLGRLRTSAIGTGEGVQAYGHGLYFAGKKAVADWYRRKLSKGKNPGKWEKKPSTTIMSEETLFILDDAAYGSSSNAEFLKKLEDQEALGIKLKYDDEEMSFIKSAISHVKDGGVKLVKKAGTGSLYKVELIPKDNEYLLYDKTLGEQPQGVQDKLKKFLREKEGQDSWQYRKDQDWRDIIYNVLDDMTDPEISRRLKEAGIPGIKYLDGLSRSKGKGDFNYVIFDEADVQIIEKLFMPTAWHGTPHTLAPEAGAPLGRFKTSKIGTGEGAQAYGHGLYFAGTKEVANWYKKKLETKRIKKPEGQYLKKILEELEQVESELAPYNKIVDEAYESGALRELQKDPEFQKMLERRRSLANQQRAIYDILEGEEVGTGSLYEVDLAPKENEYVYYDEKLKDQPRGVQNKLKKLLIEVDGEDLWRFRKDASWTDLTNNVLDDFTDIEISQLLKEVGIPGIKFIQRGDKYGGKYNYIIFDEADITVTDKLFMPASEAGAGKRKIRQPANRITRQAPAMPGNRFMAPAVSAGAKSAERFR